MRLLTNVRDLYIIRLGEIDAPESGQPYGRASKKMLSDLVFGQTVNARVTDVDRYGRSVAVISRGGTSINAEMVKRGGAWPSGPMARAIANRRAAAGRATAVLTWADAGHALAGPGSEAVAPMLPNGGTATGLATARGTAWAATIAFLKRNLMPESAR